MMPLSLVVLPRSRRRFQRSAASRLVILAVTTAGLTLLAIAQLKPPRPLVILNLSTSMPVGLYRTLRPFPLAHGDLVSARLPRHAARLAAERGYLPENIPLIKAVVALPGDLACAGSDAMLIWRPRQLEQQRLLRRSTDPAGRRLPAWQDCRRLRQGEVMLAGGAGEASFDSRYLGPLRTSSITARLVPLWTR